MVPRPKHQTIREIQRAVMEVDTVEQVAMEEVMVEILEEAEVMVAMMVVGVETEKSTST